MLSMLLCKHIHQWGLADWCYLLSVCRYQSSLDLSTTTYGESCSITICSVRPVYALTSHDQVQSLNCMRNAPCVWHTIAAACMQGMLYIVGTACEPAMTPILHFT